MKDEALKLALEALETELAVDMTNGAEVGEAAELMCEAITSIKQALAAPVQEPVEVDQATMELAESAGLIGPASRTHDLHAAIQRFHDLICVNATIKAAQMAADAIRESTPPAAQPAPVQPVAWMSNKDFEPIRSRIMGEAYELAERDVEGYNAIKVMCGDVQKMLPAQRQWVGLTDEERTEIRREHYARTLPLMDAVEAKLRSRNT
jgi:hypothetical protein